MFKMISLEVFWVRSLKLLQTKSQRSGQICHIVLSCSFIKGDLNYYSSQFSRVCVAVL